MSTYHGPVSALPIDLKSGLTDADGSAVALVVGETYTLQNVGSDRIYVSENAAAPANLAGPWHIIDADGDDWQIDVTSDGVWARTEEGGASRVVVTEAD